MRQGDHRNFDPSGNGLQFSMAVKLVETSAELRAEMRILREAILDKLHALPEQTAAHLALHLDRHPQTAVSPESEGLGLAVRLLRLASSLYGNLRRLSILFGIWSMVTYGLLNSDHLAEVSKAAAKEAFKLLLQAIIQG